MNDHTRPELVSIAEAADRYRIARATLRRMVDDGEVPAYRVTPRIIRLDVHALDRIFLAAGPKA